jgi:hypothetical protein
MGDTEYTKDFTITVSPAQATTTHTGAILYQPSPLPAKIELYTNASAPPIATAYTAGDNGAYTLTIPVAPAGTRYTLVVTKPGYLSYTIKNLTLTDLEENKTIDIRQLAGDVNGDGIVNAVDLTCLLSEFNRKPVNHQDADIDGNGVVNAADLTYLLAGFNKRNVVVDMQPGNATVNFSGIMDVTVQYNSSGAWFDVPGTFDNTTGLISIPPDTTSVRAVKGGMGYQFDNITFDAAPLVLNVPVGTIVATGVDAACMLGLRQQNEWAYPLAPASIGVTNEYNVFDNGIPYEVHLSKPGFFPVTRPGIDETNIYAGYQVNFGDHYFYQTTVPAGVSDLKIISNGTIVEGIGAGQKSELLCDFYGMIRTARLSFMYGGIAHDTDILLDGIDPFGYISAGTIVIPFATVEPYMGNQSKLTVTVTEFFPDGTEHKITANLIIENDARGIYTVGPCSMCGKSYTVYVDVKGNDQVRVCRMVQY